MIKLHFGLFPQILVGLFNTHLKEASYETILIYASQRNPSLYPFEINL